MCECKFDSKSAYVCMMGKWMLSKRTLTFRRNEEYFTQLWLFLFFLFLNGLEREYKLEIKHNLSLHPSMG
jgi:hypothetical protein